MVTDFCDVRRIGHLGKLGYPFKFTVTTMQHKQCKTADQLQMTKKRVLKKMCSKILP
jgi:hypothetical protein